MTAKPQGNIMKEMCPHLVNLGKVATALLSGGKTIICKQADWLEIKQALVSLGGAYDGQTAQNEALTFCHFLLYANQIGKIPLPIEIERSERPDFRVAMVGQTPFWGIEHTRATIERFAQDCRELEKWPDGTLIEAPYYSVNGSTVGYCEAMRLPGEKLRHPGYGDNGIETQWTDIILHTIEKKSARQRDWTTFWQNDLLMHYVGPAPIFMRFDSGVAMLKQKYMERSCELGCFQRVHILIGSGNLFIWDAFGETIKVDARHNV